MSQLTDAGCDAIYRDILIGGEIPTHKSLCRAAYAAGRTQGITNAAKICDAYPDRDPAGDGNGYWAAEECAAAIRALDEP